MDNKKQLRKFINIIRNITKILMKTYTSIHTSIHALNQTSSKPNLPMTETVFGQLAHKGGRKLVEGRLCLMQLLKLHEAKTTSSQL